MPRTRVNEIDLLRFIAALMVVFYHLAFRGHAADDLSVIGYPPLAAFAKYGYLGVQLFFMISGFVILMTAAEGGLRSFVVSRVIRLYPAFWACCTITYLTVQMIGDSRFVASAGQYLVNMTMLSEFLDVPSIDGVYWSLFVEIRFYLLVAAVLLFGGIRHAQVLCVLWLAATCALEIAPVSRLREWLIAEHSPFFIAGAICYLIWKEGATASRLILLGSAWGLGVHKALTMAEKASRHYEATLDRGVVIALVTLFFVTMLAVAIRRTGRAGQVRWTLAGALTYPLYLIHQNVGYMLFNWLHTSVDLHVLFWTVVAGTILLAYLVHVLVERPLAAPLRTALNRLPGGSASAA